MLITIYLARATSRYFENIHMKTAGLIPAEKTMVVVYLTAVRTISGCQITATLLRIPLAKKKPKFKQHKKISLKCTQLTCTFPISKSACAVQYSQYISIPLKPNEPSGAWHSARCFGTNLLARHYLHVYYEKLDSKTLIKYFAFYLFLPYKYSSKSSLVSKAFKGLSLYSANKAVIAFRCRLILPIMCSLYIIFNCKKLKTNELSKAS